MPIFGGPPLSAADRLRNILQARQQMPKPPGPDPEEEDLPDLAGVAGGFSEQGGLAAPAFELGNRPDEGGLASLGRPQLSGRRPSPAPAPQAPAPGAPQAAPQGRYMPDIGTAMAAAAEKARTGQSLDSIYEAKGLRRYGGGNDLEFLRDQAKAGNNKAQENLWTMAGKDPEKYQNLLYGRTQAEREQAGEAEDKRRFDLLAFQKDREFYEGGRRFDAGLGEQRAARESGEKYKNTMAEIERQYKEGQITVQQAKIAADKASADAAAEMDQKRFGLQERQFEASQKPKLPTPQEQEAQELALRMQRAQVGRAEKELGGEILAPEQRARAMAANQEAQGLVDQGLSPDEALRRVAGKYGLPLDQIQAPEYSQDPQAAAQRLSRLGITNEQAAYKAALDRIVADDPSLRSALGGRLSDSNDRWLFQSSPANDPAYRASKKAEIVRALIADGIPGPDAARIANKYTGGR